MTKNNTFFKILFAIELALLPMVIFAQLFLPEWGIGLFVAGVLLAKIWMELFNDKTFLSAIIIAIGNVLVFAVLLILFMATKQINLVLGIFTLVFIVITNVLKVVLFSKTINDTIQAVDYCYVLFECITLIGLAIMSFFSIVTTIGLFAVLLTSVVSVAYKIFYIFKYTDFATRFKSLFKRR